MNARENRNVFSLDLNVPRESLSVTVLGREFQVAGADQRNARLATAVLANGSDNRVVVVERRVRYIVVKVSPSPALTSAPPAEI